jgi:hypothetical protein
VLEFGRIRCTGKPTRVGLLAGGKYAKPGILAIAANIVYPDAETA